MLSASILFRQLPEDRLPFERRSRCQFAAFFRRRRSLVAAPPPMSAAKRRLPIFAFSSRCREFSLTLSPSLGFSQMLAFYAAGNRCFL
jgi:hypothetical protein